MLFDSYPTESCRQWPGCAYVHHQSIICGKSINMFFSCRIHMEHGTNGVTCRFCIYPALESYNKVICYLLKGNISTCKHVYKNSYF